MLQIYPKVEHSKGYKCPVCRCQLSQPETVRFVDKVMLADIACTCCEEEYYQTMPWEYSLLPPISFLKNFSKVAFESKEESGSRSFLDSIKAEHPVSLEIIQSGTSKRILLLNCLDVENEKALQKLLMSQRYLTDDKMGLIVLVPDTLKWLVPREVSEIWSVSTFPALEGETKRLNTWLKDEFVRFEEVHLAELHHKVDVEHVEWEKFLKPTVLPIALHNKPPFSIVFYYNEEKLWHSTRWESWLYNKLKSSNLVRFLGDYFEKRQAYLFSRIAQKIKQKTPASFFVIGNGRRVDFPFHIQDLRHESGEELNQQEKWFPLLTSSHVVVGCFDPLFVSRVLASASIDIVPGNRLETFWEKDAHPRRKSLFGSPSVEKVADQILSYCKD